MASFSMGTEKFILAHMWLQMCRYLYICTYMFTQRNMYIYMYTTICLLYMPNIARTCISCLYLCVFDLHTCTRVHVAATTYFATPSLVRHGAQICSTDIMRTVLGPAQFLTAAEGLSFKYRAAAMSRCHAAWILVSTYIHHRAKGVEVPPKAQTALKPTGGKSSELQP